LLLVVVVATLFAACEQGATDEVGSGEPQLTGPFVRVLGTVQDGGVPHAACRCVRCLAASRDPARKRRVASLGIILPQTRQVFLIDATPDIREQLDLLRDDRDAPRLGIDRSPVDGVFLTHAHMGHYTGLAFFGFEAVHTRGLPVYCSARFASYLRDNGPWSQLVEIGNVTLRESVPGDPISLSDRVSVTPLVVPHRDEFSDTVGFLIRGPASSLLYIPDADPWKRWDAESEAILDGVDIAILDGSFYSGEELPGRDLSAIGHPLIVDSMRRFESRVSTGQLRVYFTHLNHSNPALDPAGPERAEIERRGFRVLDEGEVFPL
jgi:pyrroloquinoline quinone biosynthesis protein B